jgi:hypothetical protein
MPLPTNAEIEAGFEQRNPTPGQAQRIAEMRAILIAAAREIRDRVNGGPFAARAFNLLENAFTAARSSVMNDPVPLSPAIV